jgi:cytochrome P450
MMARTVLRDTSLLTGGGPRQDQPIHMPNCTKVQASFYALHRNLQVFSVDPEVDDVKDFLPERWDKVRPAQWEYVTFGGGQRACLGKEKALVEAAFVICKLVREFEVIEAKDERPWKGQQALSAKNINGCHIALRRSS